MSDVLILRLRRQVPSNPSSYSPIYRPFPVDNIITQYQNKCCNKLTMIRVVFGAHSASCCCHCSVLMCLARRTGADDLSSQSFAFHQNSCRCSSVLLLLLLLTNIILQCTNGRDNRQTCMWIIQFWRRRVSQSLDLCDSYSPELPLFSDWQLDRHTMSSVHMKSPRLHIIHVENDTSIWGGPAKWELMFHKASFKTVWLNARVINLLCQRVHMLLSNHQFCWSHQPNNRRMNNRLALN